MNLFNSNPNSYSGQWKKLLDVKNVKETLEKNGVSSGIIYRNEVGYIGRIRKENSPTNKEIGLIYPIRESLYIGDNQYSLSGCEYLVLPPNKIAEWVRTEENEIPNGAVVSIRRVSREVHKNFVIARIACRGKNLVDYIDLSTIGFWTQDRSTKSNDYSEYEVLVYKNAPAPRPSQPQQRSQPSINQGIKPSISTKSSQQSNFRGSKSFDDSPRHSSKKETSCCSII